MSSSAWKGSKASVMVPFRVEVLAFFIMGTFSPMKERKMNLTATVLVRVRVRVRVRRGRRHNGLDGHRAVDVRVRVRRGRCHK